MHHCFSKLIDTEKYYEFLYKQIILSSSQEGHEKYQFYNIRKQVLFPDLNQQNFDLTHEPINDIDFGCGENIYKTSDSSLFVYTIRSGLVKFVH